MLCSKVEGYVDKNFLCESLQQKHMQHHENCFLDSNFSLSDEQIGNKVVKSVGLVVRYLIYRS